MVILLPVLPPPQSVIAPLHSHSSPFHLNLAQGPTTWLSLVTLHTNGDVSLGLS